MELENITFGQYLALPDPDREQYDFFMMYSTVLNNPTDTMAIGDMTERSFGLVKDMQYDLSQGMTWTAVTEYIIKLTSKSYADIAGMPLDQFCQGWKYIQGEIERITEIEAITLAYTPTDDEVRAGIDRLAPLGMYLQFRSIAKSLGYSIDQVKAMRYDEAFLELTTQKLLSEYETEIARIHRENAARK